MNLTWVDAGLLTVLFTLGSLIVQSLARFGVRAGRQKPPVVCDRHSWVRLGAHGLVCQGCGKIPG
jgi:hypothetical protein